MPDVNLREFERMRNGGARTSVRVQPAGTAVTGYQVNLGNRPSLRDIGAVRAHAWTAEQTESWARIERLSATCPCRLVVFEGGKKNIDRCMEFGDDFEGLNSAKWTTSGTVSVSGGVCTVSSSGGQSLCSQVTPAAAINTITRSRIKSAHYNTTAYRELFGIDGGSRALYFHPCHESAGYNTKYEQLVGGQLLSQIVGWSAGTYLILSLTHTSTGGGIWTVNDANSVSQSTYNWSDVGRIEILAYLNGAAISCDWTVVRKYAGPAEPIAGTAQPSTLNRSMCQSLNLADGLRACCAA